jgi:hypothetical protein
MRRWTCVADTETDRQTGFKTNIAGSRRWYNRGLSLDRDKKRRRNFACADSTSFA